MPAAARSWPATPTPSASRSPRTGRSRPCTATRARRRIGCALSATFSCSGPKRRCRFVQTGGSAHFIAPSTSNGCAMACAYFYVPRRKGYANPISIFVNIDETCQAIRRHAARKGGLPAPGQIDGEHWVYDIGENGDLSVDAAICDNVKDLVATFRDIPNAKGSFATKFVNPDLLAYDPQGKT